MNLLAKLIMLVLYDHSQGFRAEVVYHQWKRQQARRLAPSHTISIKEDGMTPSEHEERVMEESETKTCEVDNCTEEVVSESTNVCSAHLLWYW